MLKEVILLGYFSEAVELCNKSGYSIVGYIDSNKFDFCDIEYLEGNERKYVDDVEV